VVRSVDPAEAERLLRDALDTAAGAGDYLVASMAAGELVNLLRSQLGEETPRGRSG
jgi:hypothetical protein